MFIHGFTARTTSNAPVKSQNHLLRRGLKYLSTSLGRKPIFLRRMKMTTKTNVEITTYPISTKSCITSNLLSKNIKIKVTPKGILRHQSLPVNHIYILHFTRYFSFTVIPSSRNDFGLVLLGACMSRSFPSPVFGNAITSRIFGSPSNIISNLSNPHAIPP